MSKKKLSTKIYPSSWEGTTKPHYVLSGSASVATGATFGADVSIVNKRGNTIFTKSISGFTGYDVKYLGGLAVLSLDDFPITINSEIQCNSDFDTIIVGQIPLGLKEESGEQVPGCYQSSIFCNDSIKTPGHDTDFNDFVLNWQLFSNSTDNQ